MDQEFEEIWFENSKGDQIQGWVLSLGFRSRPDLPDGGTGPRRPESGDLDIFRATWHEFQTMVHHRYIVF